MSDLSQAISHIIKGNVVIIPTECSYCYVADPFNKQAIDKLDIIKKSQQVAQEYSILIGDLEELTSLVQSVDSTEEDKIMQNWPGETTILLNYPSTILDKRLLYKNKQVALRLPKEDFILEILHGVGQPLACFNTYDEERLIKDSLHFKNSDYFCLKILNSLSGNLPKII